MKIPTASQTVGPYFSIGLGWRNGNDLSIRCPRETPIEIRGRLLDGAGDGADDALIEIWQADAKGQYPRPVDPYIDISPIYFVGAGRAETDSAGEFEFRTIKPGRVPGANGELQAPHVCLTILARGLLQQLHTRLYFSDEPEANAQDEVLRLVPEERRHTLIAQAVSGGYQLDIRLQGPDETVFFDF